MCKDNGIQTLNQCGKAIRVMQYCIAVSLALVTRWLAEDEFWNIMLLHNITSNHPRGANPLLSQHRWAQNVFSDLLTFTFNLGHSQSIGFVGPIRSYIGPIYIWSGQTHKHTNTWRVKLYPLPLTAWSRGYLNNAVMVCLFALNHLYCFYPMNSLFFYHSTRLAEWQNLQPVWVSVLLYLSHFTAL